MKDKLIKLSEAELTDLYQGIVIAMKQLDLHRNGKGSDGILSDRLELLIKKIEKQAQNRI